MRKSKRENEISEGDLKLKVTKNGVSWSLGTWSSNRKRSEVEKHGSASDKARLPQANRLNVPHGRKRSFTVANWRGVNKEAKRGAPKRRAEVVGQR